jgi:hypothetical protein
MGIIEVLRKGGQFGDTAEEMEGYLKRVPEPKGVNHNHRLLTAGQKVKNAEKGRREGGKRRFWHAWHRAEEKIKCAYSQRGSSVERAHRPHVVQTLLKPTALHPPRFTTIYTLALALALAFTNRKPFLIDIEKIE